MGLGFLQTARYSAQPLSKHIDTPEQAQPVYTCMNTLLADMMEDARQIRLRSSASRINDNTETSVEEILDVIAAHPGQTVDDIAKMLGRAPTAMRSRLSKLQKDGQIKYEMHRKGTVRYRVFFINDNPPEPKPKLHKRQKLQDAIDFMRASPGCTVAEIAEHMGISTKTAAKYTMEARKVASVRMERLQGQGNNTPARYWIEEAAQ